jgi:hypothetical protein
MCVPVWRHEMPNRLKMAARRDIAALNVFRMIMSMMMMMMMSTPSRSC